MMEKGIVVKTENNFATVRIDKKSECNKCGMCFFPKNVGFLDFTVKNTVNANVGDLVYIEKTDKGKFLSSLLLFLVPLFLIGLSPILGIFVLKNDLFVLFISFALLAIWFLALFFIDKKLKNILGESVKIIKKENIDTKE